MKDQSVPARWRLLGIINGFAINGKDFYASNEWIMTQLDCSQQTVSSAVKELEDLGEIACERTQRSRVIRRTGTNQLVPPYKPTRVSDTSQLVPNSYSNSDNTLSEVPLRVEKDTEDGKVKKDTRKYPNAKQVFRLWGKYPAHWVNNATQLRAAENLYAEQGLEDIASALKYIKAHQDEEFFPQITSPWELDTKWDKLEAYFKKHA